MDLTYREIAEILRIVDASGFTQLTIEDGSFRLSISRGSETTEPAAVGGDVVTTAEAAAQRPELSVDAAPQGAPGDGRAALPESRRVNVGGLELAVTAPADPVQVSDTAVAVTSPMLGVFYRRPSPEAPPYVEVGARVAVGDTLCLVESMKMFMPVQSPVDGTVVAICVENKALVEFNQPLIYVEPEAAP